MSEKSEFFTFLAQTHKAFPNASAPDLIRNARLTIEGRPPAPLKRVDPSKLPQLIRTFPILDRAVKDPEITTSYDLLKHLAGSHLPPEELKAFNKENLL